MTNEAVTAVTFVGLIWLCIVAWRLDRAALRLTDALQIQASHLEQIQRHARAMLIELASGDRDSTGDDDRERYSWRTPH